MEVNHLIGMLYDVLRSYHKHITRINSMFIFSIYHLNKNHTNKPHLLILVFNINH